jgi:hypothetical protein
LLGKSGFLINSHDPLCGHVLKHIRQNCLTRLRYSVANMGRASQKLKTKRCCVSARCALTVFGLVFGVRYAHTGFGSSFLGLAVHSPFVSLRAGDKIGEKARTV